MADDFLVSGFACSYCETLCTHTDFNCTDDEFTKAKQLKTEKKEYVLQCTDCEDAIGDVEDAIHSETSLIEDPADCEMALINWMKNRGKVPQFLNVPGIDPPVRLSSFCRHVWGKGDQASAD